VFLLYLLLQVDRVLESYTYKTGRSPQYLVKWAGLEYSWATWEEEEEVTRDGCGRVSCADTRTTQHSTCTGTSTTQPHLG
jgi:hypothetical protein